MINKIKKRDGRIVDFEKEKIYVAIKKACDATNMSVDNITINNITDNVVSDIDKRFLGTQNLPGVEDIQDMVEKEIAKSGLFDVAKKYILYRYEHKKIRDEEKEELLEHINKHDLKIITRSGKKEYFDISYIRKFLKKFDVLEIENEELKDILEEIKNGVFEGIKTKEITRAIIMSVNARIEKDPAFSYLSARILMNDLYKDIIKINEFEKGFEKIYKISFKAQMEKGVKIGLLDKRLLEFDFKKLEKAMDVKRDFMFTYMGFETLYERYFARDYEQNILELPQHFLMRVAMGMALNEDKEKREDYAIEFYNLISNHLYIPSTPTLFHSGTNHPQMSSCYLNTVEDNLTNIFKVIGDNAQLSKWSGALGTDWTSIRGTGSLIKSTNVSSQGVIVFMKIEDATTAAINRSGKRRGAACMYLETWHYDIEDFIELRKNTGDERRRIHDTDIANWIPDLFMKRVLANESWTLFSPDETPDLHEIYGKEFEKRYLEYERMVEQGKINVFKKVDAMTLWRKMVGMLFESGHPWMVFKDPCNIRSPQDHVGVVHSSNLCTEITLNTSVSETAVCNLGSINLSKHITKEGKLDKKQLAQSVKTAMRMLDNVIDLNFYPTIEAQNSNFKHRPVGLGIMGLQDAFYKIGLDFDSDKSVEFSDEVMEYISYHAILTSSKLAKERGAYSSYKGSKWSRGLFPIDTLKLMEKERGFETGVKKTSKLDWSIVKDSVKKNGMRNSNCMAIAPTATISTIVQSYPSIEPIYENLYVKSNQTGEFTVINEFLVNDLRKLGLWNEEMCRKLKYYNGSVQNILEIPQKIRDRYKEAFEIDPIWVIKHAAHRGKWIDQSQSVNIFTSSQSGKVISDIYVKAWEMGLKTTYYLRTLGASTIEKSTLDINKKYEEVAEDTKDIPQCLIDNPDCEACQ